jgi:hypothetical protein
LKLTITSYDAIEVFVLPDAAAAFRFSLDLIRGVGLPGMDNALQCGLIERLEKHVNMIVHHNEGV